MKEEALQKEQSRQSLTYAKAGVDRSIRESSRAKISTMLRKEWKNYVYGRPLELPFGPLFPNSPRGDAFFDLQIEGIGTKTLLAELDPEGYRSIGVDGVAMVVNDVIRSGATPMLLADATHVAKSHHIGVQSLVKGVMRGARLSGCTLASGETGDVAEILHKRLVGSIGEPFDLMVSCLGVVSRGQVVNGRLKEGDVIIGIESSGIHSNGISLARKILLKAWGGKYEPHDIPEGLSRSVIKELLEPTRIYAKEVLEGVRRFGLKAAVHITGDGFGKFQRLLDFQVKERSVGNLGIEFDEISSSGGIFNLIEKTSKALRKPISKKEMYRTFNMGYGFAVVADFGNADSLVDLFNKYHPARRIGRVTKSGRVVIRNPVGRQKTIIL